MKRKLTMLAMLTMALAMLAGCGGRDLDGRCPDGSGTIDPKAERGL